MASKRLSDIASHIVSRPSSDSSEIPLPTYDELPSFKDFPGCAWGVWGRDDQLGTVNLLTEAVVQRAATEEIRCVKFIRQVSPTGDSDDMLNTCGWQIGPNDFFELVRCNAFSVAPHRPLQPPDGPIVVSILLALERPFHYGALFGWTF